MTGKITATIIISQRHDFEQYSAVFVEWSLTQLSSEKLLPETDESRYPQPNIRGSSRNPVEVGEEEL